nr:exonuclease domain-containing protein [Mycobacterium lepraemurium]
MLPTVATVASDGATQLSFADVGPAFGPDEVPLRDTTFVMVDLETTGERSTSTEGTAPDAITEIGAAKVRGGVVLGEFATLLDPQRSIPPQIMRLTGITTAMVSDAPAIDAVLPMFLEFAGLDRGAVLVAHNAGSDVGFLRAAAQQCDIAWPRPRVLCTVRRARRVLSREEAPSVPLASLARLFAVTTQPTHRALDDARATVRRAARSHRAGQQPGCAHLRRPARLPARRDAHPAPQTGAGRGVAAPAGGVPVPRAVGRGALHRHRRRPAAPGRPGRAHRAAG